jgi:hypothetical protein
MSTSRIVTAAVAAAFLAACSTSTPTTKNAEPPKWRERSERKLETMERGTEEDPEARDRWYWEQRAYPAGFIPVDVHRRAIRAELARIAPDAESV